MKPAKPVPRSPSESIFTRLYHDAVSKRQDTPAPAVPAKVERRLSKAVTNALVKKLVGEQCEKAYRRLRDRKKGVEREMREIRAAPAISQTSRRIATRCRSRDGNVVFRAVPRLERRKKPPKEVELRLADLEEAVAAPRNPPPFAVKETVFQQAKDEFLLLDSKHRPSSVTQLSQESSEVYLADLLTPKMFTDMASGGRYGTDAGSSPEVQEQRLSATMPRA